MLQVLVESRCLARLMVAFCEVGRVASCVGIEAGREFEIDHFGALMYFCIDDDPAAADALARPYIPPGRANAETLARCTAFGPASLVRERLEEYVEAGGSKFVLRPMCPPERMMEQLARLAEEVVPDFQRRR